MSCLNDADQPFRESVYLVYEKLMRGVRKGNYKLIEYSCQRTELFDLEKDPSELHDLSEESSMQEIIQALRAELVTYRDTWHWFSSISPEDDYYEGFYNDSSCTVCRRSSHGRLSVFTGNLSCCYHMSA